MRALCQVEDAEHSHKRGGGLITIPRCATDAERGRRYAEVEFMACGKPMIPGVDRQAREILEKAQGGICVEPENATALTAAIANLYGDPQRVMFLVVTADAISPSTLRERLATVYSPVFSKSLS